MKIFIAIISVALFVFIFDKTCLWLEKKGYLYYRNKKPTTGIVGTALQELSSILLPSHRHVYLAKEKKVTRRQNKAAGSEKKIAKK